MAAYTYNGMEFEDISGNSRCIRLTAVREPANEARVLTIPDTVSGKFVSELGKACCCGAKCESVVLSRHISAIGERAFLNCPSLKNFSFPDGIKEISGEWMFRGRSLGIPDDRSAKPCGLRHNFHR